MQLGLDSLPRAHCSARSASHRAPRSPAVARSAAARRPRQHVLRLHASGGEGADAVRGEPAGTPSRDAVVRKARETQLSASELLAEFLQAADLDEAVTRRVSQLDEAWFNTVSTYIALARKDGQPQVEQQLTAVLRAAAGAKDATLRPEIRLLNALMRVTTAAERELLYQRHAQTLVSDNEYFFSLLARMTSDVEQQPGGAVNPGQRDTLTMLRTIAKEARRRKPAQS